jgi:hypothetical protein
MPQTDAILAEDNKILVCEAKSFSHISDPREYFLARNTIDPAVSQIDARIAILEQNEAAVRRLLGIKKKPEYFGMIITNGRFFEGVARYRYPVLDIRNLIRFLQNPEIQSGIMGHAEDPGLFRRETTLLRKPGLTHIESLVGFARENPDFKFHNGLYVLTDERWR